MLTFIRILPGSRDAVISVPHANNGIDHDGGGVLILFPKSRRQRVDELGFLCIVERTYIDTVLSKIAYPQFKKAK